MKNKSYRELIIYTTFGYTGQTDFFLNHYEEAVKRPFGNLLIDLKTTTHDNCRLRTNVLPSEEPFNQVVFQENIPQELLKYPSIIPIY